MTERATIVLFDIDGTLVTCGGAGRRAMERAFVEAVGDASVGAFGFGGMTDRAIAREALTRASAEIDEARLDALLERYLAHLADELPRASAYEILPGVLATLDALDAERARGRAIAVGLGTGNLERGAALKLVRGGLWDRFAFGGYGSDHEDRAALLARGAARGRAHLPGEHSTVAAPRVVVIGDTPRDVAAAHAIGARCIAVATGSYDADALRALAPHRVLPTLEALTLADVLDG